MRKIFAKPFSKPWHYLLIAAPVFLAQAFITLWQYFSERKVVPEQFGGLAVKERHFDFSLWQQLAIVAGFGVALLAIVFLLALIRQFLKRDSEFKTTR